MEFNTALDMERLEGHIYFHYPNLKEYSDSGKESIRSKLYSQLHESLPSVNLQKYQVHMFLVNIEKNLQKCKDFGIIATTNETSVNMQQQHLTTNIKVPELSDLSGDEDIIKPRSVALKHPSFSEDDTLHSDYEDNVPLALRRTYRKRQYDSLSNSSKMQQSHCFYRQQSNKCSEVMKSRGVSDSVKVSKKDSVDSPLTFTILLPTFLHETEKKLEISIDLGKIDLARQVFNSKKRHISVDECRKRCRVSSPVNKSYPGTQVHKNSQPTYFFSSDNEGTVHGDGTLASLISEVLKEPNGFDTICDKSTFENNEDAKISDTTVESKKLKHNETNLPSLSYCEIQDEFINKSRKHYNIKDTSRIPNSFARKRGRKPNQNQNNYRKKKSDLAKYVESFGKNCDPSCAPATPVTMSEMVTSTTQNCEQPEHIPPHTAQITYFLNGQWVDGVIEVIPPSNIGNINLDTYNVTQDDDNRFEDFVNYIDSSNNDVGNNVIARVLDGSNIATANATWSVLNVDNNTTLDQSNLADQFMKPPNEKITNLELQNHNRCPAIIKMDNVVSFITETPTISNRINRQDNQILSPNEGVLDLSLKSDYFSSTVIADDTEAIGNRNCDPIDLSIKNKRSEIQQKNGADNLQLTQGDDESDDSFLRHLIDNNGFDYKTYETDRCSDSFECTDLLLETVLNTNESFKAALDMPLLDNDESPLVNKSSVMSKCDNRPTFSNNSSTSEDKIKIVDTLQNKVDASLSTLPPLTFIHTPEGIEIFHSKESSNQSNSQLQKSLGVLRGGDENIHINNNDCLDIPPTMSLILKPESIKNIANYSNQETVNTNNNNNNIGSLKVADKMHSTDAYNIYVNRESVMTNYTDSWKHITSVESEKYTPMHSVYESLITEENKNLTFKAAKIVKTIKKNEVLNNTTFILEEKVTKYNMGEKYTETSIKNNESSTQVILENKKNEHPFTNCNKMSAINLHAGKLIDHNRTGGNDDNTNLSEKFNDDNHSNTYNNENKDYMQTAKSKLSSLYTSEQIVARVEDIETSSHNHENNVDFKLEKKCTSKNKNIRKPYSNLQITVSDTRSVNTLNSKQNQQQTIKQNERGQCGEHNKCVDKSKTNQTKGLVKIFMNDKKSSTADIGVELEITKTNANVDNAMLNGCKSKLDYKNRTNTCLTNIDVSVEQKLNNEAKQPDKTLDIIVEINNDNEKKNYMLEKETFPILTDVNIPKEYKNINICHESVRNLKSAQLINSTDNIKTARADVNILDENVDLTTLTMNQNFPRTLGKRVGIKNYELKNEPSKNITRKAETDLKKITLESPEKKDRDYITDPMKKSTIVNKDPLFFSNLSVLEMERTYDSYLDFEYQLDDDVLSLAASCFNSPDDDRYCSKLSEESGNTDQIVKSRFLNNKSEEDPLNIKPLENVGKRTEEIQYSVDQLTKFKIPKLAVTINQLSPKVNESPTKTKIGLSKITRTVQNICAVPPLPLQPAALSSASNSSELPQRKNDLSLLSTSGNTMTCDLIPEKKAECKSSGKDLPIYNSSYTNDRGKFAGRGGEAINRGAAMIDIAKIFGPTCFAFLVDKCAVPGSLQHNHQLRDPTLVQIALEGLPKSELYIAYKFMFNHSKLFKRYFFVFCNVYSKLNNRSKLLNMVYDCEKQCVFLLRNIFYSLLECGFNKVNACRQILGRSRDKSSATIDVLVGIILEADWGIFCDYLERFAEIPHYSYRINLLNDMASGVLRTKDGRLSSVVCKCLLTLNQEDYELLQRTPDLIALLELMKDGKVC